MASNRCRFSLRALVCQVEPRLQCRQAGHVQPWQAPPAAGQQRCADVFEMERDPAWLSVPIGNLYQHWACPIAVPALCKSDAGQGGRYFGRAPRSN